MKLIKKISVILFVIAILVWVDPIAIVNPTVSAQGNPAYGGFIDDPGGQIGADFTGVDMPKANTANNGFIAPVDNIPGGVNIVHISTEDDLDDLAIALRLYGGGVSTGMYYVLDNDINLTREWVPLNDFRGTFDGRGHSINNLYVNKSSRLQSVGLFGQVGNNNVGAAPTYDYNVTIKNVAVNIASQGLTSYGLATYPSGSNYATYSYAGGIIGQYSSSGRCKSIRIENCYVNGDVSASSWEEDPSSSYRLMSYAGGILGYSSYIYNNDPVTITNCYSKGSVSAPYAGGIIGFYAATKNIIVSSCYSESNIFSDSIKIPSGSPYGAAGGGLIGYFGVSNNNDTDIQGLITNCYATGKVTSVSRDSTSSNSVGAYTGGLIGEIRHSIYKAPGSLTIKNCYATGKVESETLLTGGFIGALYKQYDASALTIENCYASGDVSSTNSISYTGGFAGWLQGGLVANATVKKCHAKGNVTVTTDTDINSHYTGGFIGMYESVLTTENCYAEGSVKVELSKTATSYFIAGGMFGYYNNSSHSDKSTFKNCYAKGNVTTSGMPSTVQLGGLFGQVVGEVDITNCFAEGSIRGNYTGYASGFYAGGLIGSGFGIDQTVSKCYAEGNVDIYSAEKYTEAFVGGLIGSFTGKSITDSHAAGGAGVTQLSSDFTSQAHYYSYAGGLIGDWKMQTYNTVGLELLNCTASGYADLRNPSAGLAYAGGLVGNILGSASYVTIKIENCSAEGYVSTTSTRDSYSGGLIGNFNIKGTVTNCRATGGVEASASTAYLYGIMYLNAGGLIGSCGGLAITVSDCSADGWVNITDAYSPGSDILYSSIACGGGLIGRIYNSDPTATMIKNSNATADVTIAVSYNANAGGLIGEYNGLINIQNCHTKDQDIKAAASANFSYNSYTALGGLVGAASQYSNTLTISDSYSTSVLYGNYSPPMELPDGITYYKANSTYGGGIIGKTNQINISGCYAMGGVYEFRYGGGLIGYFTGGYITGSYATGGVEGVSTFYSRTYNPDWSHSVFVGGLYGYTVAGTIENCYAKGFVNVFSSHYGVYTGGLAGYSYGSGGNITMSKCFATGDVYVDSSIETSYSKTVNAGGLTGYFVGSDNKIENCYATGNVSALGGASELPDPVVIPPYVYGGGLAGYVNGGTITNCYATGNIYKAHYAGGLIGYRYEYYKPTVNNPHRLSEQVIEGTVIDGTGVPLSPAQMRKASSFTGWDFSMIWGFDSRLNDGYPILRVFYGNLDGGMDVDIVSVEKSDQMVIVTLSRPRRGTEALFVAVYDSNGRMLSMRADTTTEYSSIPVPVTISSTEAKTIKVMMWDSVNTMQPLCEPKTMTKNGSWAID